MMEIPSGVISVENTLMLFILFLCGYFILQWVLCASSKTLPPGPREWSTHWKVLKASWNGTMPQLVHEYAKHYGDITYIHTFGRPIVVLNTADISRRLLASEKYKFLVSDRFTVAAIRYAELSEKDIIFCKYNAIFRKKRRLFHNVLGVYGDGVERFESIVWAEMERMFAEIDQITDTDVDLTRIMCRSLKLIIYILAMGEYPTDPTIPDLLEEYDLALNLLMKPGVDFVLQLLPFITKVPGPFKTAVDRLRQAKKRAEEIIFYNSKITYKPGQPRGIADHIMDLGQTHEWMNSDKDRIGFLTSIFVAAHLTSRATLAGAFFCLLNYPEVIKKIQEEIDRVIGTRLPKIEYKSRMPYTEATVIETLRIITPLPITGYRVPSEDLEFEGMTIPKDSLIFMNNWFFLHDERVWEDPWTFKPERYLDDEGNLLPVDHPKRKNMIVFGVGTRACPGEVFSRSRIFLFITSILQRYDILPPVYEKLAPVNSETLGQRLEGIVRPNPPFKCRLLRRQNCEK